MFHDALAERHVVLDAELPVVAVTLASKPPAPWPAVQETPECWRNALL